MTLEELQAIPLQCTFGYSADSHGLRQYVNEEHGIAKQVYTPRNKKTGEWGKGEATYKLLNDSLVAGPAREFDNLEALLAAINAQEKT
jgi:hypothetical protein